MSDELERGDEEQESADNRNCDNPSVRGRPSSTSNPNGRKDEENAGTPQQKAYATWKSAVAWVRPRFGVEVWTAAATLVMAIAMIVYTIVTWQQWKTLRSQLEQMIGASGQTDRLLILNTGQLAQSRKLAEAAKAQAAQAEVSNVQSKAALDASVEASRLDQRAWVTVQGIVLQKPLQEMMAIGSTPAVTVLVENSGRTPATDVAVAGSVIVRQVLSMKDLATTVTGEKISNAIIGPRTPPGAILLNSDQPVTTQRQIDAINNGITRLYAIGTIFYRDVFHRPHKTEFCFSAGIRDSGLGMAACKEHNSIE